MPAENRGIDSKGNPEAFLSSLVHLSRTGFISNTEFCFPASQRVSAEACSTPEYQNTKILDICAEMLHERLHTIILSVIPRS
jgi:hypothetical protein